MTTRKPVTPEAPLLATLGPSTVDRWPKPHRVVLIKEGCAQLRDLLSEMRRVGTDLARLRYEWPESPLDPGDLKMVSTPARLLEVFLNLADASDDRVRDFAERYGGLGVFVSWNGLKSRDWVIDEFCDVWRYFASAMRALLRIASSTGRRKPGDAADWEAIGAAPKVMSQLKAGGPFDPGLFSPEPHRGEAGWLAMTHFVAKGSDRDWRMWTRLVNALLELGRVRPWVMWEGPPPSGKPFIAWGTPFLFSHLALQLSLTAVRREAFVVCSYCHREYSPPVRAPRRGQRNFCPECKQRGIPTRLAQRDRRERLRAKGQEA